MGAITNKSASFRFRPWELKSFLYHDVTNECFLPIQVDIRTFEIMRITSSFSFLTNQIKYSYLSLNFNQLFKNYIYTTKKIEINWYKSIEMFEYISDMCKLNSFKVLFNFIEKNFNYFNNFLEKINYKFNWSLNGILPIDLLLIIYSYSQSSFGYFNLKVNNFQKLIYLFKNNMSRKNVNLIDIISEIMLHKSRYFKLGTHKLKFLNRKYLLQFISAFKFFDLNNYLKNFIFVFYIFKNYFKHLFNYQDYIYNFISIFINNLNFVGQRDLVINNNFLFYYCNLSYSAITMGFDNIFEIYFSSYYYDSSMGLFLASKNIFEIFNVYYNLKTGKLICNYAIVKYISSRKNLIKFLKVFNN